MFKVPGPIHVDPTEPWTHTQTVEGSYSGLKMRLRLGRGLPRHNLQPVMDMEDFVYNRTNGGPQELFKGLGDVGVIYMTKYDSAVTM